LFELREKIEMKNFKICHVNLAKGFGGGERQSLELALGLKKKEVDQLFVVRESGQLEHKLKDEKIPFISVRDIFSGHFNKKIDNKYILHAHDGKAVHWCSLQKFLFKNKMIVTRRVINPISEDFLTKKSYEQADVLVGISSAVVSQFRKSSLTAKILLIPDSFIQYGSDPKEAKRIKDFFRGAFLVIHAAALEKHKGVEVTINCARRLEKDFPDIRFAILGKGNEEGNLKKLANGLKNIKFFGFQSNMGDWLCCADVSVLPSYQEGLGSVLLESMKGGVAVIGSDVGGIPDLIEDNVNGFLIEPGNDGQLARDIIELYSNKGKRDSFVKKSYEKIKRFDPKVVLEDYLQLYNSLK